MRKVMDKVMGIKKEGGQEVLITLGMVGVGVVLLLAFSTGGQTIISGLITTATGKLNGLFTGTP